MPLDHAVLPSTQSASSLEARNHEISTKIKQMHDTVRRNLDDSANKMNDYYEQAPHRRLQAHRGRAGPKRKPERDQKKQLLKLWLGPYRVEEVTGPVNVKIRGLDNTADVQVVHVDRLKHFHQPEEQPQREGGERQKMRSKQKMTSSTRMCFTIEGQRQYHVRWRGFTKKYDSWVPEGDISAADLLERFRRHRRARVQFEDEDEDEEEGDSAPQQHHAGGNGDNDSTVEYPPDSCRCEAIATGRPTYAWVISSWESIKRGIRAWGRAHLWG
jgi:hypothetical protein